jgi:hypothetical protein
MARCRHYISIMGMLKDKPLYWPKLAVAICAGWAALTAIPANAIDLNSPAGRGIIRQQQLNNQMLRNQLRREQFEQQQQQYRQHDRDQIVPVQPQVVPRMQPGCQAHSLSVGSGCR